MKLKELFESLEDAEDIDPSKYVLLEINPWLSLGHICASLQDEHNIWARAARHKKSDDLQNEKLIVKKDDAEEVIKMINEDHVFDTKHDRPKATRVKSSLYHFFHTYF